jgi:hypothetical protein
MTIATPDCIKRVACLVANSGWGGRAGRRAIFRASLLYNKT